MAEEEATREGEHSKGDLVTQAVTLIGISFVMFGLGFMAGSSWQEQKRGEKEKVVVGRLLPPQVEILSEEAKPGESKEEEDGQFWNILLGKETSLFPQPQAAKTQGQEPPKRKEKSRTQEEPKERPRVEGPPSAKVQVQAPSVPPPSVPTPPPQPHSPRYSLQVISLQSPEKAESIARELSSKGYPGVRVKAGEVPGRGTWYRVWVGSFGKKEEAEALAKRLKEMERLDAQIVLETR